ncbi:MAG TPA: sigma-70 family RNA polymerase sigma factor [Beijerinckiaceae bacterium]|nr:sigma-70 family RNA polymerase sigma factor [Beijerinckiaceae bacterium]
MADSRHAPAPSLAAQRATVVAGLQRRQLAAVAERHDTAAFLALFDYFAPRVKAYMKKLGAGEQAAEELTQDAMLIIWRKAATYDPTRSAVSSWIFTVARNLRIDAIRRDQRRVLDLEDPALFPDPQRSPDEEVAILAQQRRIRSALAALPPEQEAVIRLAFYQGYSHGEIAAALHLPLGTVKSRLRLAFQRLRVALNEDAPPAVPKAAGPAAAVEPAREAA